MRPHPWDCPGKDTGVGCHFLLQCIKVKSESEVAQPCPTLHNPMVCSLLLRPWDFPGKSTGVECHCLLHESAMGIHISPRFWTSLSSASPAHPSRLIQSPFEFPELCSKFPLAIYFAYGNVSFHVTLSIHLIFSPLLMSISLFSVSVSPLMPCKYILQNHFSRFHICALAYDISLSLSDSLHSV